jgi:hypothetical protein
MRKPAVVSASPTTNPVSVPEGPAALEVHTTPTMTMAPLTTNHPPAHPGVGVTALPPAEGIGANHVPRLRCRAW